jgi:hypothetical protein
MKSRPGNIKADHPVTMHNSYSTLLIAIYLKGTWFTGTGSTEHKWLYNYNFYSAQNVYVGLLQIESSYMQGNVATKTAPAP